MSRRARTALALVPTLAGLISGGVLQARATTPPAAPGAVQAQQTPPTTSLLDALLQGLTGGNTTTTAPAQPAAPAAPAGRDPAPPGDSGSTTTSAPEAGDRTVPPEAQAIINSVARTGSNNNLALLEALRPLLDSGMTQEEAALVGMGQFPVAGEAWWSDDWLTARFTPTFHLHQGTDIFAARGTPVRSPVDGRVEFASEGAGGLAAYVTIGDGTYYYMAHLDSFATDIRSGQSVKQGTVVGFVGSSGNAEGGSPHVHFEIRPGGGAAINPKTTLDRWVSEAIANVPKVKSDFPLAHLPRPLTAAGLLRRLDVGSLGGPTSTDGPWLWTRNARRAENGVRLTSAANGYVAAEWDPMRRGAERQALERRRAQQIAREVLWPLTPKVLNGLLEARVSP